MTMSAIIAKNIPRITMYVLVTNICELVNQYNMDEFVENNIRKINMIFL